MKVIIQQEELNSGIIPAPIGHCEPLGEAISTINLKPGSQTEPGFILE